MRVSIRAPHEGAVGEATGGREVVTALQSAIHQQSGLVIAVSPRGAALSELHALLHVATSPEGARAVRGGHR